MTVHPDSLADDDLRKDKDVHDFVADAIMDMPHLGERWLIADENKTDNRELVADSIATFIRQEWALEYTMEHVLEALEAMDDDTICSLMQGPPGWNRQR